ncbi:gliding-associated putative ABC transporter substrate-binding component GldG [Fodinibius roseus]|uniref:Gliding-associated putative ABC transporter substrate-binding component GldG n=1 Tax=Fodinibius roseus TaxID=1194090 RepID=A0A1M5EE99_9BACT|nr:Gldg family protein [Fodinibius roseus]SHF77548.1 gliding-associated putative ABC transporter substrate-binding component GldG [Fodinibius roseus]
MNNTSTIFAGFLKNRKEAGIQLLLIVGIAVAANVLAEELVVRLDLTENNRYTLSQASIDIAESLEDPVTVTAYFSENMPPNLNRVRSELLNFLEEFRAYSDDNLEYKFVNPNKDQATEQEAQQAGVRPVTLDIREQDQVSQKRAYLGVVFSYRGQQEAVPFVQPGGSMEYTIASKIKQLTIEDKPRIGLLQGHGEPPRQQMQQLVGELEQRYELVEVSGLDTTSVPADIESLLIIKPEQELSQNELVAIDQYLMSGGHAVFAVNRVRTMMQRGMAMPQNTGVNRLLAAYNIPVQPNLIRDASASAIQVQQNLGGFQVMNNVQYPYIPQVTTFSDHPVSAGLESVMFQFVSSLDTARIDSVQSLSVLASSSERSGVAQGRFNLNPRQNWTERDFMQSHLPLAAAVEGTFRSAFAEVDSVDVPLRESTNSAIIVIGDGDFVINGPQQRSQQLPADNISLMVNSVDWLADDTGLIDLRTQQVTDRSLMQLSDRTKTMLKYLNLFLPILLILGYGFFRYQRRRTRRRKWIEEGI